MNITSHHITSHQTQWLTTAAAHSPPIWLKSHTHTDAILRNWKYWFVPSFPAIVPKSDRSHAKCIGSNNPLPLLPGFDFTSDRVFTECPVGSSNNCVKIFVINVRRQLLKLNVHVVTEKYYTYLEDEFENKFKNKSIKYVLQIQKSNRDYYIEKSKKFIKKQKRRNQDKKTVYKIQKTQNRKYENLHPPFESPYTFGSLIGYWSTIKVV